MFRDHNKGNDGNTLGVIPRELEMLCSFGDCHIND